MSEELEVLIEDRVRVVEAVELLYKVGFGKNAELFQVALVDASINLYKVRDEITEQIKKLK